ncbi:hypothetical protein RJ640_022883, partial [Escallonia rubra]
IEVKSGKTYTHHFDSERGRLHISQATLGAGSYTKKSIVQCVVGDKKPIYLCSLLPEKQETCPLNLDFEEDDEVRFSVIGPNSIHLSGFFYGESQDDTGTDFGSYPFCDSYGEESEDFSSSESEEYDTNDDEDGYIVEEDSMFPSSRAPNSGEFSCFMSVRIEEIRDDEKPAIGGSMSKRPKKKDTALSVSDDGENSRKQIMVSGSSAPVFESEDEDGFPLSPPDKTHVEVLNTKEKAGEVIEKRSGKKKKVDDDPGHGKSGKRKIDAIIQDGDQARNGETGGLDSSVPLTEVVPQSDLKHTKKNKKKKEKATAEKAHDAGSDGKTLQTEKATTKDMDKPVAVRNESDQKPTSERMIEKKNKKKSKKHETPVDADKKQTVGEKNLSTEEEEKAEATPFQVRSLPNGLVIEELVMGRPDGKKASPGKKVSVHYIGKLKKNGKIFDSNIGRAPFEFRLGIGKVIKGWDVGVNGMRIGDKRRLTIPPAMGYALSLSLSPSLLSCYGAGGAPGAIPPNAWLVFDVELVNVS